MNISAYFGNQKKQRTCASGPGPVPSKPLPRRASCTCRCRCKQITVPTLDHCALNIFFGAMETRNEYFATLEIGVRKRVRKQEIIPVRAGAQLCAIAKLINVINSG
jgi:hypothetical protein